MLESPRVTVNFRGRVPSKSNRYRTGRGRFYVSDECGAFEESLVLAFRRALPRAVSWGVPRGRKRPQPIDPIYPPGIEVEVRVVYRRPASGGSDTDGILKALLDAATRAGVWGDDRQVKSVAVEREWCAPGEDALSVEITQASIRPSGHRLAQPSPLGRREWLQQRAADESLGLPESIPTTYCDACGIAIGPYCAEEEAWVEPYFRPRGALAFRVICGSCADRIDLDWKYCVIPSKAMRGLRRFEPARLIKAKVRGLTLEYADRRPARTRERPDRALGAQTGVREPRPAPDRRR